MTENGILFLSSSDVICLYLASPVLPSFTRGGQAMKVERCRWELERRLALSHGVNRPPTQ